MKLRLRSSLAKIGEPRPNRQILRIRSNFHSTPPNGSLRAIIKAMNSPQVSHWQQTSQGRYYNYDWTEACQGVTDDGQHWYFSSNNRRGLLNRKQGIYKFTRSMEQIDFYGVEFLGNKHIGDIDYYDGVIGDMDFSVGLIFAAMEEPAGILTVTADFRGHSYDTLKGKTRDTPSPQGSSLPWCAINPWNGHLYSSKFGNDEGIDEIYVYSLPNLIWQDTLKLEKRIRRVQGGCFSDNGHLLLTSDHSYDIRCYSVLNGAFLGSAPIEVKASRREEVEGLTIWKNLFFDGQLAQIHVVSLDNDLFSRDDVYFKHYTVPNPEDM